MSSVTHAARTSSMDTYDDTHARCRSLLAMKPSGKLSHVVEWAGATRKTQVMGNLPRPRILWTGGLPHPVCGDHRKVALHRLALSFHSRDPVLGFISVRELLRGQLQIFELLGILLVH